MIFLKTTVPFLLIFLAFFFGDVGYERSVLHPVQSDAAIVLCIFISFGFLVAGFITLGASLYKLYAR